MFSQPRNNVILSDEGYSIEVLGRASIRYEDGQGAIIINSEFLLGEPSIRVLLCASVRWEGSSLREVLPSARKREIGENIRRAFVSSGHEAEIVYQTMTDWRHVSETLFGDVPLDRLLAHVDISTRPWESFASARNFLQQGDNAKARATLLELAGTPSLEPRLVLQAWHALRELGQMPPAHLANELLGVVVEVGMYDGLDLLAAYPDHTARYFNYSGSAVIWERPNQMLDRSVDKILDSACAVLPHIGVWGRRRRPPPEVDVVRLNLLTPAGLSFGEGPFVLLASDPIGGPLIAAATALMKQLTEIR